MHETAVVDDWMDVFICLADVGQGCPLDSLGLLVVGFHAFMAGNAGMRAVEMIHTAEGVIEGTSAPAEVKLFVGVYWIPRRRGELVGARVDDGNVGEFGHIAPGPVLVMICACEADTVEPALILSQVFSKALPVDRQMGRDTLQHPAQCSCG